MTRCLRPLGLITIFIACSAAAPRALRADPGDMSASEYKLWVDYKNALEDPRVKRMKPRSRLPRIARNFGVKVGVLKRAIAKGERFGETILAENQAAAEKAVKASKVGAKITSVELVEAEGTVISYVSWKADDKERLAFDATYIARAVADAAPLTDTIALWACMGKTKVWTGMIRLSAAGRINASRIEDFAKTRYLRLFEDVHNRFEGKPPVRPKRDPETGKPLKDPKTGKPVFEPDDEC